MMYSIKAFIKNKGETLSSIACKLKLSRPTFDTYISMYEEGLPIPKARYQKVFDQLFSDKDIATDIFKARLDTCAEFLDGKTDCHSIEHMSMKADRMSAFVSQLRQNMNYQKMNSDLYDFINLLITHSSDDIFYHLMQYFLLFYGKKDITQISDLQKAYYSEFHRTFNLFEKQDIVYSITEWKEYQKQCENAQAKNKPYALQQEQILSYSKELRREIYDNRIW